MIAEELGMDPVEIRLRNAIENPKPGSIYETINKVTLKTCGIKECIEKVAEDPVWKEREKRKMRRGNISRGVGFASVSYLSGARP